ncbi:MAG: serine--tRNA ligase [Candidatus Paceibacterota bacterium]|jgi:seryl-tRNA synthetase
MLDIDFIRTNVEVVKEMMVSRNKTTDLVDQFLDADARWRALMQEIEEMRALQKKLSAQRDIELAKSNKVQLQEKEGLLADCAIERRRLLLEIPNVPFSDVPRGKDESENVVLKTVGDIPSFDFEVRDHLALGEALNIIDTKKAAEVSGSRFYYLKNAGALLEFALIRYAIDVLTTEGFSPVIVPVMIKPEVYERMGRLTDSQKEERYYLEKDDTYLVGSAEHTLGPLHMDESFAEKNLPKRYVGFSTCFRREAGSYGKDTKGILRVHQFDKVEMYVFANPDHSEEEHRFMLSMQEKLWQGLEIPYRVVGICTGDMGPTDARQFDVEAWIPSQKTYREVASCSNTTDYQTRGINTKIKRSDGSSGYAHALNATALALGRTIIAIMENNQQKDGSIVVPEVLRAYVGTDRIAS